MSTENIKFENIRTQNGGYISAISTSADEIGKLTYTIQEEKKILIISYVMVFPKHEGHGYGKDLVEQAVEFARENKWKIYPHCSFSKSVLDRIPNEVSDVYP